MPKSLYQLMASTVALADVLYAGTSRALISTILPTSNSLFGKIVKGTSWCYFQNVAHDLVHSEGIKITKNSKRGIGQVSHLMQGDATQIHINCKLRQSKINWPQLPWYYLNFISTCLSQKLKWSSWSGTTTDQKREATPHVHINGIPRYPCARLLSAR